MQENLFEIETPSGPFKLRLLAIPTVTLEAAAASSKTYNSLIRRLNLDPKPNVNHKKWLVSRLDYDGIDRSHLDLANEAETRGRGVRGANHEAMSDNEILETYFVMDSPFSWPTIKALIWIRNFLPKQCSECGISSKWNGIPLVLQIDHINGDNADQRIDNLRVLCPNCHSQTDTFCGGNKERIDWEEFLSIHAPDKMFDIPPSDGG